MHPRLSVLTLVPFMILVPPDEGSGQLLLTDYRSGDIAAEEIGTPIELDVLDSGATALARHAAISGLPPAYRLEDPVEMDVIDAFESTRQKFAEALEQVFGSPQLSHRQVNSTRFREFRLRFQRENTGFPVGNLLGLTWGVGAR